MSETPKCTSWLGHKFEGRYSTGLPPSMTPEQMIEMVYVSFDAERNLTKAPRTYERDICAVAASQ